MKKFTTLLMCLLFLSSVSFSQDEKEHKYLFSGNGDNPVKVSGFASVFTQFSFFNKDFAVSNGGGAAILLNQKFFIGGYGQGISTRHDYKKIEIYNSSKGANVTYDDLQIKMGHGGFWLGYIFAPHKAVHFLVSSKIGFGALTLGNDDDKYKEDRNMVTDKIFVFTDEVGVELNLLKWFRINVMLGYRYVGGVNKEYSYSASSTGPMIEENYFGKNDFNSFTGSVNLVFGWFHQ